MVCATGRVVGLKVEADGDIHLALQDATGNGVGTVSAEIPVGPKWSFQAGLRMLGQANCGASFR